MKEEMEELHIEGLATHGDPESCVPAREGWGEALTGARVGRAIEPRNSDFRVSTLSKRRKTTSPVALCEAPVDPARSEIHGMHGTFMRENREGPRPPVQLITGAGRSGNAEAVILG
jgi:hypothetical protein